VEEASGTFSAAADDKDETVFNADGDGIVFNKTRLFFLQLRRNLFLVQEATKMLSIYLDNHESASCTDMKELFSMQMGTKLCPGQLEITESDLVLYQKVEWSLLSLPTLALVSMYCSKEKNLLHFSISRVL
jgi:hypothetical protein